MDKEKPTFEWLWRRWKESQLWTGDPKAWKESLRRELAEDDTREIRDLMELITVGLTSMLIEEGFTDEEIEELLELPPSAIETMEDLKQWRVLRLTYQKSQ